MKISLQNGYKLLRLAIIEDWSLIDLNRNDGPSRNLTEISKKTLKIFQDMNTILLTSTVTLIPEYQYVLIIQQFLQAEYQFLTLFYLIQHYLFENIYPGNKITFLNVEKKVLKC